MLYMPWARSGSFRGKTVILVTHHIHEIPPEMDRVILLAGGKVVADGKKATVLTSKRLSRLFETPVELVRANGYYQAVPAHRAIGTDSPETW